MGIRVTAVDCGPLTLDRGVLMTGSSGLITVPTAAYIIEHPKHGVILFDTGVNYRVADEEEAEVYWGPGVRAAFGCGLTRDMAIDRQLDKLGYKLTDVKHVILSHMHLDHAGGMTHFPHAKFYVQKVELRYAWWPDPFSTAVYCLNDYKDTRGYHFIQLEGDADIFDDGSIRLITTPGHSPGHQSAIVRLEHRGPVFLGADSAHLQAAYQSLACMPFDWSIERVTDSYHRMRMLEAAGVELVFSHDPDDFARFPHDGEWAD
ncbi:N-acyl homoserine lactonase family protein [Alicyclobacillus acidiphilus]|uniref:N-acyl homoserine lactonase family protein n=1 Tax=Alicyclobacillus acidiphilus TaxID=182455 RepID=UPI000829CFFB|nr:N-acyl homoserine lactonase family protein [Alicyclobacillus acidiphilus]